MLKQQLMTDRPKHVRFSVWKRLILIASVLPGVSLATLIPNQAAYANQVIFICKAGNGGNGGVAINGSNGGGGSPGGDCINGPKAGEGSPGGDHGSAGGHGGSIIF